MTVTTDRSDPRLGWGLDFEPVQQRKAYLVLSDEERAAGFVRPVRVTYIHKTCDTTTTMNHAIAETYARDPSFYGATYCCFCKMHLPVSQFRWVDDREIVGS